MPKESKVPQTWQVWQTRCRVCQSVIREGQSCEHTRIDESGQVYQVHEQHQNEPDPYAVVTRGEVPEAAPLAGIAEEE